MVSARRLSRLVLGVGALAAAAVALAAGIAASHVSFSVADVEQLLAACGQWLPPIGPGAVAVLAVIGLVATVLVRGSRASRRQVTAQRRLSRRLRALRVEEASGVRFLVMAGATPRAFCAGLVRPQVYVSQGALAVLDERQLRAVLAHEDHHRRRRDPLRLAAGAILAEAFFFVPALRRLHERYRSIAEMAADEAAVRAGGASALAAALLRFAPAEQSAAVEIAPERVDHLLGGRAGWNLPVARLLGSLLVPALLVAVAVAGSAGSGTVNVPMALMGSCAMLMSLAAIGAVAGVLLMACRQRR